VTKEAGPEYQKLMEDIRERITSGEYPVGRPIPSTPRLGAMAGVSVTVVRRAVQQLQADGILEGHPGKGVFVKAVPAQAESERLDLRTLSGQVAALQREVHELTGRAATAQPADFASDLAGIREAVGRIEANLIDLYGKTGHDYPQGSARDGAEAAAGRGRRKR